MSKPVFPQLRQQRLSNFSFAHMIDEKIISLSYASIDEATLSYRTFDLTGKSQLRLNHYKLEVQEIYKLVLRLNDRRLEQRQWREEIMEDAVKTLQTSSSGKSVHHHYPHSTSHGPEPFLCPMEMGRARKCP